MARRSPIFAKVRFLTVVLISASLQSDAALSFDNIEADAAYEGVVRQQTAKEFASGLTMLKSQAESLKMSVREQDLKTLASHMYDKAHLTGSCYDQAYSIKKIANPKIEIEKFVAGCVNTHMQFSEQEKRRAFLVENTPSALADATRLPNFNLDQCLNQARFRIVDNKPYDFLQMKDQIAIPQNYIKLKLCRDAFDKK